MNARCCTAMAGFSFPRIALQIHDRFLVDRFEEFLLDRGPTAPLAFDSRR